MIGWILLALGVIAIFIISKLVHFEHFQKKVFFILIIVLILIIVSTFTSVVYNNPSDLTSVSGIISVTKVYFMWVGQTFGNIHTLTANAIKMDWMPKNVTFAK